MIKLKKIKRFVSSFLASSLMLGMINVQAFERKEIDTEYVIEKYHQGVYLEDDLLQYRKELVENNNLQEYVDEEYFFKEEYLFDFYIYIIYSYGEKPREKYRWLS